MKFLPDLDIQGKTVLLRINANVPMQGGKITDDFRLRAVLPTIKYVSDRAAKTVLCGHLGRPAGRDPKFSFASVANYLRQRYPDRFVFLSDCIGEEVKRGIATAKPGSIILLENVRFHKGERNNDEAFGKALAQLAEVYVNDAFGDSYEPYASIMIPPKYLPSVAGLRLKDELAALDRLKTSPKHPFVVIVGGVKIAEKMGTIEKLAANADHVLVGGGIANTMLAAAGYEMRSSLVKEEELPLAKRLQEELGAKLIMPVDVKVCRVLPDGSFDKNSLRFISVDRLQDEEAVYDIGPATTKIYAERALAASDVFWAGPVGYIEWEQTAAGSLELVKLLAASPNYTVIGGGETASLAAAAGVIDKMDFVSTGGGAALKYLSGEPLPGLQALG